MAEPRFYIPDAELAIGDLVPLPSDGVHHAMRVLRLREDDPVILFNGKGKWARGPIHFSTGSAQVRLEEVFEETPEKLKIILLQALVSVEKSDWIVEKACEMGVSGIYFFPSRRSEVKLTPEKAQKRVERWRKTCVSACMQCGRPFLPEIAFISSLKEAFEHKEGLSFVTAPPTDEALPPLPQSDVKAVSFLIGPEGGMSKEEIEEAVKNGFRPLTLGKRVLRTETAGIALAAWAQTLWGDYGENA